MIEFCLLIILTLCILALSLTNQRLNDRLTTLQDKYLMLADIQNTRKRNRELTGDSQPDTPVMASMLHNINKPPRPVTPITKRARRKFDNPKTSSSIKDVAYRSDGSVTMTFPGGPPPTDQKEAKS